VRPLQGRELREYFGLLQTWDAYGILRLIVSIIANNSTNVDADGIFWLLQTWDAYGILLPIYQFPRTIIQMSMPMESFGYNRSMLQTWDAYGILQLIVSIFANNYTNAR